MVHQIVRRARRRLIAQAALAQLALAGALVMAALLFLLVLGTRILDWRFPLTIGVAGLLVGAWRTARAVPSGYASAIRLDHGGGLQDAVSTAFHFAQAGSGPVCDAQQRQALRAAESVDLGRALPLTMPRAAYAMAALFLAACAVFAVRFGIARRLDLQPGLARMVVTSFHAAARPQPAPPRAAKPEGLLANVGIHLPEGLDTPPASKDPAPESLTPNAPLPHPPALAVNGNQKGDGKQSAEKGSDDSEGGDPNRPGNRPGESAANSQGGDAKAGKGKPQPNPDGDNAGLMARMKEALSGLLAKAKQAAGQQPGTGQKTADRKTAGQPAAANQKGSQAQGQQGAQEASQADAAGQAGKPGDPQSAPNDGQSPESRQTAQAGSGVGRQNGSKDLKAAQQIEAMGKLSAIIGKRSQNVSGEMMLDTQSGPQRLSTAYSSSRARHAEAGGDVSRDQVPLALQSYVQQYFEEVRKTAPPRVSAPPAPVTK